MREGLPQLDERLAELERCRGGALRGRVQEEGGGGAD